MDLSCLKKNELINLCIQLKINLKLSKKNTTKLTKAELKLLISSHNVVKEEVKEEVKAELREIKEEVRDIKAEVREIKEEVRDIKAEVKEIKEEAEVKKEVKEIKEEVKEINILDLFCGCGGMSKGLHDAGLNIIAGIDIWDVAINSYKQNFNHLSLCKDLTTFSPENLNNELGKNVNIDVIVGGPPCQAYSIAGKRDLLDPRSLLFIEYIKYVNYFNPKLILMENVIGILSIKTKDDNLLINTILGDLHNYNCIVCKLYASDFEVPQNRRRVIIIGVRKDLDILPTEPIPVLLKHERIPVSTVLQPREEIDNSYYLSERAIIGINNKKEKSKLKKNGFGAQFLQMDKPSYTIPARYWHDGYDALVKYDNNDDALVKYDNNDDALVKYDNNDDALVKYDNNDDALVKYNPLVQNIRRLTILELRRIQSFPDDYILTGSKKEVITQIGNAVACKFAYHLGIYIKNIFNKFP